MPSGTVHAPLATPLAGTPECRGSKFQTKQLDLREVVEKFAQNRARKREFWQWWHEGLIR